MIRGVHGTKKGQLLPASSCVPSRAPTDGTVGKVRSCAFIYLLCRRRYDKVLVTLRVHAHERRTEPEALGRGSLSAIL